MHQNYKAHMLILISRVVEISPEPIEKIPQLPAHRKHVQEHEQR